MPDLSWKRGPVRILPLLSAMLLQACAASTTLHFAREGATQRDFDRACQSCLDDLMSKRTPRHDPHRQTPEALVPSELEAFKVCMKLRGWTVVEADASETERFSRVLRTQ